VAILFPETYGQNNFVIILLEAALLRDKAENCKKNRKTAVLMTYVGIW
jgi:hypothetical protein